MEVPMCPLSTFVTPSVPLSEALIIAFVLNDCRVCHAVVALRFAGRVELLPTLLSLPSAVAPFLLPWCIRLQYRCFLLCHF